MQKITVVVVCTTRCNLRCDYCYGRESQPRDMSVSTLEKLVRSCVRLDGVTGVKFIWHGGEPLLLGLDFFQRAVIAQKTAAGNQVKVLNNLQTNGTLLTPEWINFFRMNGFKVSCSLDGPPKLTDLRRHLKNGKLCLTVLFSESWREYL